MTQNEALTCSACGGDLAEPQQIMCEWDTPLDKYYMLTFCWGCNREWILQDGEIVREYKRGTPSRGTR